VIPEGKGSTSVTPVAGDGPLFVTTSRYEKGSPITTGSGTIVLTTERSAATEVETLAALFDRSGSVVVEETEAALTIGVGAVYPAGTWNVAVIVDDAPAARPPRVHGKPAPHKPPPGTNVRFVGVGSFTTTPTASEGPLFVTTSV